MQERQRDASWIPGLGRFPGGGNGNPLQYSCLENPLDRGAWWVTAHRITKSRTRQSTQAWCSVYFSTDNFSQFRPVKYIAGILWFLKCGYGTFLAAQWLRLNSAAGGVSSVSGQGTKIPHALQCSQKKVDNYSLHWVMKIKLHNAYKVLSRDTVRLKVLNNCKLWVTLYSSCFIFLFQ